MGTSGWELLAKKASQIMVMDSVLLKLAERAVVVSRKQRVRLFAYADNYRLKSRSISLTTTCWRWERKCYFSNMLMKAERAKLKCDKMDE